MTNNNFTSMRGFLVLSTSVASACISSPSDCTDIPCHIDNKVLCGSGGNSESTDLTTLAFPFHTRYTSNIDLFATTSLLDFGTLMSDSEPSVRTLDVINRSPFLVKITHVAANGSHPALLIRIANQTLPGRSLEPRTVAVISVSVKHVSKSATLSGFITAYTEDKLTYVKVPYFARLVYGTLLTRTTNSSSEPSTGLHHSMFLQNLADIPLLVREISLPRALHGLITVYNQSCTRVLQPNTEQLLLNMSVRIMPTAQVVGSLTVVTNVSTINLLINVFSGHIHVRIPTARLLSEVFDFGHVTLGRRRTTTIVLHNGNPFDITIESFLLSTVTTEDQLLKLSRSSSISLCVPTCRLSLMGQTCSSCFNHIASNSSLTYSVEWGGSHVAGTITGYLLLRSTYHQFIRQFRFHTGLGELTMLPDPMMVDSLFPGKIAQRNIIIQSTYAEPTTLDYLRLTTQSGIIPGSLRLFNQHGELVTERGPQHSPVSLSADKPTLVGSVLFDPAMDCRDLLGTVNSRSKPLSDHLDTDICYTGFSLNSDSGRELLSTMSRGRTNSDWQPRFQSGLFLTAQMYTRLRSAWVRKQLSIAAQHQSESSEIHMSDAFVGFGITTDSSPFWGDLVVSYMWPRIVPLKKASARRSTINNCILKSSTGLRSSDDVHPVSDFGHPLRAHFPTTVWTEPVHCDLVIANPSDKPLVIQPFLLDAIYTVPKNYSQRCFSTDPLVLFLQTLGLPAAQETMSKLSSLIVGSFSVRTLDTSLAHNYSTLDPDVIAPDCCPILLLPARIGQVTFRLTFTPDTETQQSLHQSHPFPAASTAASHNLLFIRNNLTALEPIWLNALQGKATLTLGLVRANQEDSVVDGEADASWSVPDSNKLNASSSVRVLLEGRWNRTKFAHSYAAPDWTDSTNTADGDTPTLVFDFTERLFWPFCTEDKDPLFVYSVPESDSLLDRSDFHPLGAMLHSLEQRGEMLAGVSIRRLVVLINTGDVPINLNLVSIGPDDSKTSSKRFFEQIYARPESGQLTCSHAGFRVTPCILPKDHITDYYPLEKETRSGEHSNLSTPYVLQPGAHLSLELRHNPDFTHTSFAARLWIAAHPQSSGPVGKEPDSPKWTLCSNLSSNRPLSDCDQFNSTRQSFLRVTAAFPRPFLYTCLNALPRPWIENLMWTPILLLFSLNLIAVLLMGFIDGSKICASHLKCRLEIDRFNSTPDPVHVFSFDRLTNDTDSPSSGAIDSSPIDSPQTKRVSEANDRQQSGKKCLTTQPAVPPVQSYDPVTPGVSTPFWRFTGSLSRISYSIGRNLVAFILSAKSSVLFLVQQISSAALSKTRISSSVTELSAGSKKLKKVGSSPDAPTSSSPAPQIYDAVGESDGDGGKIGRHSASKSLAAKSAGPRAIQTKQLNPDEVKPSRCSRRSEATRGSITSESVKPLIRKKKAPKPDPTNPMDSRSSYRDGDSDTGNDTSPISNLRGSATQGQSDNPDTPMTEARIAAAVRATRKLAEDLNSQARKKFIQNKQSTRPKFNACTSSASSSSGPDHDNSKIPPTSLPRNRSTRVPNMAKTKPKSLRTSGIAPHFEPISDQPNPNSYSRKAQLHPASQSRFRCIGYPTSPYFNLFRPSLDGFHYRILSPEYGFCWPVPQDASILTHSLSVAKDGLSLSPLHTPWDEAVADVHSIWEHETSEWMDDPVAVRTSPDKAMDQLAADTRAFAESLLHCAQKDSPEQLSHALVENGLFGAGEIPLLAPEDDATCCTLAGRHVRFSKLDPCARDFHPAASWSSATENEVLVKSTAEVGTLTSPADTVSSDSVASGSTNDACAASMKAILQPGRTTNLSSCGLDREEENTLTQSGHDDLFD
ncbi:transmembrane protein 131, partial [Clonorchis sinensis]